MDFAAACASGAPLIWTQPHAMSRSSELRCGESQIGILSFKKSCGSLAVAEVGPQRWTFKRAGFLSPRVTVRSPNSETDVAIFHPQWSGSGTVEVAGAPQVHWRCLNFWQTQWAFLRCDNRRVMSFGHHQGFLKASAKLEIDPSAVGDPQAAMLGVLGWYLMILAADDAAVTVATTAAIV